MKRVFSLRDVQQRGQFVNARIASLQVGDRVQFDRRVWTVVFIDPASDRIALED